MKGVILDGNVPLSKCILEEALPSDCEKIFPIVVYYDVHKMNGSTPP
jgi:hypothetical protein